MRFMSFMTSAHSGPPAEFSSAGSHDNGRAGPASVSIPGYTNQAARAVAGRALREQINDANLKTHPLFFCIPGPRAAGY